MSKGLRAFFEVFLGFVPLILLWSIPNEWALILGSGFVVVLMIKGFIAKNISIFAVVLAVYFVISDVVYFLYQVDFILTQKALISYVLLACLGFITVLLGKPYTMYDAKNAYEKGFGESPLFIEVNILITKIWATIYLLNTVLELAFGHSVMVIVVANTCVALGTVASIVIPNLLPETTTE